MREFGNKEVKKEKSKERTIEQILEDCFFDSALNQKAKKYETQLCYN